MATGTAGTSWFLTWLGEGGEGVWTQSKDVRPQMTSSLSSSPSPAQRRLADISKATLSQDMAEGLWDPLPTSF